LTMCRSQPSRPTEPSSLPSDDDRKVQHDISTSYEDRLPARCRMVEIRHSVYTSSMALSIKSDEADRLARQLAAETGETLTEAVETALRERLDREHARHAASMRTRLERLAADVAALRVADDRTPEEIIGYDDTGLPR
jgi:antitoxin VapB